MEAKERSEVGVDAGGEILGLIGGYSGLMWTGSFGTIG